MNILSGNLRNMNIIFCIFVLMTYASAAIIPSQFANPGDSSRIVGGNAVSIEKHPYQVSLRFKWSFLPSFQHVCGGSIYSDRVIITSAQCILDDFPEQFEVVAGTSYRNGMSGHFAKVQQMIVHENYNSTTFDNDIAIVVLKTPLPLNNKTMRPIQLAEQDSIAGEMATVSGWGAMSESGNVSDVLREVQVPIVSNKVCNEDYKGKITDSMICAGFRGFSGRDACQEDSGGPLVVNGKLVGIVSWGDGCAKPKYPGVYTNVAHLHSWLMEKINSL